MSWKQLIIILLILYWFAEFAPNIIEGVSGGVEAQLSSHRGQGGSLTVGNGTPLASNEYGRSSQTVGTQSSIQATQRYPSQSGYSQHQSYFDPQRQYNWLQRLFIYIFSFT